NGATAAALEGRVICHDVRGADRKIAVEKGQVLDAKAAAELLALPWEELHLLELEPGDIHEEPAGARLSQAAAGGGGIGKGYHGGPWAPPAAPRGLLQGGRGAPAPRNTAGGQALLPAPDL